MSTQPVRAQHTVVSLKRTHSSFLKRLNINFVIARLAHGHDNMYGN